MASKGDLRREGSAAAIVAALLLPPLGVFLRRGMGREFWIATGLTCIGYIPGIVFALLVVLKPRFMQTRAPQAA